MTDEPALGPFQSLEVQEVRLEYAQYAAPPLLKPHRWKPNLPELWGVLAVLQTLLGGQDLVHPEGGCEAPRGEFPEVDSSNSANLIIDLLPQRGQTGMSPFL